MTRAVSADHRQAILRRHEAGDLHGDIAAEFGVTRDTVRVIVKAEGAEPRRPRRPLSAATAGSPAQRGSTERRDWREIPKPELRDILAALCAEGLTSQQIADNFQNCSRSAAIGQIARFKLQLNSGAPRKGMTGRRKAEVPPAPKAAKPGQPTSKMVQQTSSWRGANNPPASDFKARAEQRAASPGLPAHLVAGEARRPIETSIPVSRNLKLVELTERTCKWPHGDPLTEVFGFCGNDTAETGPYCKYHGRLAYIPATVRQRASHRSAERIS
ncbi:MAG: hypothetical protein E5W76_18870 [Mesorhizobium sp.]|nr:MAG: hypothetical protein E5W76_18870 [Mesorhizobium sp.]